MDIKINALGRSVEILGIEGDDAEDCTAVALNLWQSLVPVDEDNVGGAFGLQTERELRQVGFVHLDEGERPNVK